MAIILDDIEREYLLDFLKKYPSSWWPHQKIIEKIESEIDEKKKITNCPHEKGKYKGEKECCTKCGTFYDPGMGFSWEIDNDTEWEKVV